MATIKTHIASKELAALAKQLLSASRRQALPARAVDLNMTVNHITRTFRRLTSDGVLFETSIDPALGRIKADPRQIEHALLGLVTNAYERLPKGDALTMRTANADLGKAPANANGNVRQGHYVMLAIGACPKGGHGVQQPARSGNESNGGNMAEIREVISQSGGFVSTVREEEHGMAFEVYLPRIEEQTATGDFAAEPGERKATILVVEDSKMVRDLVVKILVKEDYGVLSASDGHEAMKVCAQQADGIDLILTDVLMPGMSGPELAQRLRTSSPGIPFIFMSGYVEDSLRESDSFKEGAAFLRKPFTVAELTELIRQTLVSVAH